MKEPVWIDERDALAIDGRLVALHGGAAGLRDEALLQSALARPRQILAYADPPDIIDMAAANAAGIVRNHAFVDGNKRTGFVAAVLFLELNGYRFNAPEEDATQAMLQSPAVLSTSRASLRGATPGTARLHITAPAISGTRSVKTIRCPSSNRTG